MLLTRARLRFSILELMAATTLVALFLGLPAFAVQVVVAAALLVLSLSVTLLLTSLLTWKKWSERSARAERLFVLAFQKTIIYSAVLIAIGSARFAFQ